MAGNGPELELQGAILARLKADADVAALIAARIYDTVPQGATFPYVTFGPVQSISDDADCITGLEIAQQMDVWSRAPGFPECKKIVDAVRAALHDAPIALTNHALVFLEHRTTDTRRDPDGLTSHGIMHFEAFVERAGTAPPVKPTFADNFNRADGPLEGSPGWTRDSIAGGAGMAAVRSNMLASTGGTQTAYFSTDLGSANHYVQAEVRALSASPGMFLCCRLADLNNWIGIIVNSGTGGIEVWRRVGGNYAGLLQGVSVVVGDTIRLEASGTNWRALKNGTQVGAGAIGDATLTSTRQGILAGIVVQDPAFDNYQTGVL